MTFADGRTSKGIVARTDVSLDVALIEVDTADAEPLPLGDASRLAAGDQILIVGNPHGLDMTVSQGIVSHVGRSFLGTAYVQVDANVNPGNSGGPLVDGDGDVVGIVSLKIARASGLGLALPINYLFDHPELGIAKPWGVDDGAWAEVLDRTSAEDDEVTTRIRRSLSTPGIASVSLEPYIAGRNMLQVVVAQRLENGQEAEPEYQQLEFVVHFAEQKPCTTFGSARSWFRVDRERDDRTSAWMKRHGLGQDIFASVVSVGVARCGNTHTRPRIDKLELIGADDEFRYFFVSR